jgi:hypothetical protein
MKNIAFKTALAVTILSTLMLAGTAISKDKLPEVTEDGLIRVESKKVDAVYWQEGATLEPYTQVKLLDAAVAFKKDWMRDYNRSQMDLSSRVSSSDMDRIKTALSAAFTEEFTKVLQAAGYEVVQNTGDEVLLLRPGIINLDVTAPDTRSVGVTRTYTASAGSMTLYMELYDSATSAKIGQVMDAQKARENYNFRLSNSVTNRAEANRILQKWAGLLADAMSEAKASSKPAE